MDHISTDIGVDSASCFSFREWTTDGQLERNDHLPCLSYCQCGYTHLPLPECRLRILFNQTISGHLHLFINVHSAQFFTVLFCNSLLKLP